MPALRPSLRPALLLLSLAGCLRAKSFEGDIRGECSDGADNDRDGAFDCDDPDCAGGVECAPGPPPGVEPEPAPEDLDGDGFSGDRDADPRDCDDDDAAVNPGAAEIAYTGVDEDCDPATPDDDLDGDGHALADDCDDGDPAVDPRAAELPYTGIDEDCDPATPDDDLDGDGVGVDDDCDEGDPAVGAGAAPDCRHPARAGLALWPEAGGMELGTALRVVPDLDGDGGPDLLVGARGAGRGAGAVYLVSGDELAAAGPDGLRTDALPAPWTGAARYDYLGEGDRLRALPDLDGDGRAELLIGNPNADPGGYANAGEVYLFASTDAGAWAGGEAGAAASLRITGRATADKLGQALEAADLDGDGLPELLVSSPQDDEGGTTGGALFVFGGDALAGAFGGTLAPADADGALTGAFQQAVGFGALSTGLDATGDGLPDLLLGASEADGVGAVDAGLASLVPGGGALLTRRAVAAAAVATVQGLAYDDQLGSSGLLLPDRTGDGVAELLIGAIQGEAEVTNAGALWLWAGGPGLSGAVGLDAAALRWAGDTGLSRTGAALALLPGADGWLVSSAPYAASGGQAFALPLSGAWSGGALRADAGLWVASGQADALGLSAGAGELGGAPTVLLGAPAAARPEGALAGGVFGFPVR